MDTRLLVRCVRVLEMKRTHYLGRLADALDQLAAHQSLVHGHLGGLVQLLGVLLGHLFVLLLLLLLESLLLVAFPTRLLVDLLDGAQLLLQLHASVLEPDLDLALRQTERVRDLDPPSPRQVVVEVEILLQLQRLEARVRLPASPPRTPVRTCEHTKRRALVKLLSCFTT